MIKVLTQYSLLVLVWQHTQTPILKSAPLSLKHLSSYLSLILCSRIQYNLLLRFQSVIIELATVGAFHFPYGKG